MSQDKNLINKKNYLKIDDKLENIVRYSNVWLSSIGKNNTNVTKDKNLARVRKYVFCVNYGLDNRERKK